MVAQLEMWQLLEVLINPTRFEIPPISQLINIPEFFHSLGAFLSQKSQPASPHNESLRPGCDKRGSCLNRTPPVAVDASGADVPKQALCVPATC